MTVEPFADHEAARFVKAMFGPTTAHAVFITSLGNDRDSDEKPRQVVTRDVSDITRFCRKWDRNGRGLFCCVGTLKPGLTRRAKDNISEITGLHTDIDFKSIECHPADALAALDQSRFLPSFVVSSGGGFHGYWLFREALEATPENIERVEAALRLLADLWGGDPAVCEVARLMRLPGTHNTKGGAWTEAMISRENPAARYELDDLEEWLAETSPVIKRKTMPGTDPGMFDNPFLAVAAKFGFKPPIDVEQRLAAMSYQGSGDTSIHQTQLQVSASLLSRGTPVDEVYAILSDATRAAAGQYGQRWNWTREDRAICRMCEDWVKKNPEKTQARVVTSPSLQRQLAPAPISDNVVSLATARKPRAAKSNTPLHIMLAEAVLTGIRARGDDLLFTQKAAFRYVDGLWRMETDGLKAWLDVETETACRALEIESANRLIAETRQLITRNPDLWHETIDWDAHGQIPTRSGLIDPDTLHLTAPSANHYCTWRVECDYDPAAECPWWLIMLDDFFGDRPQADRAPLIQLIQEILGAALVDIKPRALSKALILQGGSNFGKSGILEVTGGLFGPEQIATGLEALEGSHGLIAFVRRLPWVLHEAFDQRKWHFSSVVKAIITGEPVSINIKNGPMLSQRVRAPIFWGTNHPPQFREATKAIVNRLIVIECRREFTDELIGAAAEGARRGFDRPSSFILATELSGLLNWAIAGLRRAKERGFFDLPAEVKETADEIRRDSNLVAGFMEECVEFNPERRVSIPDFCAAFSVWWLESKGEDRRLPSNEAIGKAVVALGDLRIAHHSKELRDNTRRYYAGIRLTESGVKFWQRAVEGKLFEGKTASTTTTGGEVNTFIPEAWGQRNSVRMMRLHQIVTRQKSASASTVTDGVTVTDCDTFETSSEELSPDQVSPTQRPEKSKEPLF